MLRAIQHYGNVYMDLTYISLSFTLFIILLELNALFIPRSLCISAKLIYKTKQTRSLISSHEVCLNLFIIRLFFL